MVIKRLSKRRKTEETKLVKSPLGQRIAGKKAYKKGDWDKYFKEKKKIWGYK